MDLQSTEPADNGGGPPTLAQPGVVKAVCGKCRETLTWQGVADPPICPRCFEPMIITAATGETVEQAIAAAAQELPDRVEPVQPTLPGLRPLFDLAGALTMIEDAAQEARVAEAAYEGAKAVAKRRRDAADQANTTLRDLIRDLAARRHDARYESRTADGDAVGDVDTERDVATLPGGQPQAPETNQAGFSGLAGSTPADSQPDVLDCSNAGTLALLHQAGADKITLEQVEDWNEEQVVLARAWAFEQIEMHRVERPGTVISVQWPAHVSLAHHGPDVGTHTPKKRTKRTKKPKQ